MRKVFAEPLDENHAGEWRHRDEDEIDVALPHNATGGARERWEPGYLGVGKQQVLNCSLEDAGLAGGGGCGGFSGRGLSSSDKLLDSLLEAEGQVESDGAMEVDLAGNLFEQRGVGADGGCIVCGEHIEPDAFGGKVTREAGGAQHSDASRRRK